MKYILSRALIWALLFSGNYAHPDQEVTVQIFTRSCSSIWMVTTGIQFKNCPVFFRHLKPINCFKRTA